MGKVPRMDLYDKLPAEVRRALGEALAPISVEYLYSLMQRGTTANGLINEIKKIDAEQHHGAVMYGVVPSAKGGFVTVARRVKRRVR